MKPFLSVTQYKSPNLNWIMSLGLGLGVKGLGLGLGGIKGLVFGV